MILSLGRRDPVATASQDLSAAQIGSHDRAWSLKQQRRRLALTYVNSGPMRSYGQRRLGRRIVFCRLHNACCDEVALRRSHIAVRASELGAFMIELLIKCGKLFRIEIAGSHTQPPWRSVFLVGEFVPPLRNIDFAIHPPDPFFGDGLAGLTDENLMCR